jgi:hypothetical protein
MDSQGIFWLANLQLPHDLSMREIQQAKVFFTVLTRGKPFKNQEAVNSFKNLEMV